MQNRRTLILRPRKYSETGSDSLPALYFCLKSSTSLQVMEKKIKGRRSQRLQQVSQMKRCLRIRKFVRSCLRKCHHSLTFRSMRANTRKNLDFKIKRMRNGYRRVKLQSQMNFWSESLADSLLYTFLGMIFIIFYTFPFLNISSSLLLRQKRVRNSLGK